jgi:hypothetical protein
VRGGVFRAALVCPLLHVYDYREYPEGIAPWGILVVLFLAAARAGTTHAVLARALQLPGSSKVFECRLGDGPSVLIPPGVSLLG